MLQYPMLLPLCDSFGISLPKYVKVSIGDTNGFGPHCLLLQTH